LFAGTATLVVAGLGAGIWLATGSTRSGSGHAQPPVETVARTRALSPISACLLTDAGGVTHSPASAVWAGIRAAADDQKVRASFLPVPNAKLAGSVLNSLIAHRCSVVVAVGPDEATAVGKASGGQHPGVQFAVAGSPTAAGVPVFAATQTAAKTAVSDLLRQAPGRS
jgi:hypothetical protein